MGLIDRLILPLGRALWSPVVKQAPVAYADRAFSFGNATNKASKDSYLRYYNDVSWLRAAISVLAQAVAQTKWTLYQRKKDGDREELTGTHELKELLNRPNPFQSGHDLLELHQIFDELVGEVYWIKQRNKGVNELWLAPPQFMTVIPDAKKYIAGYRFERGDYVKEFLPEEIVPFVEPNPMDVMCGIGKAQSVGVDVETLSFLSQSNRNWFYWGSPAGTVITYPKESTITPDEIDRLSEQWNASHRSYGRAHKTAILTQGATVANASMSSRDMDYSALAKYDRDTILAVFGVSYAMLGGSEDINRANADAQLLNFARWALTPRLIRIREKLNMFLVPDYGTELEIDFEDPVPEDNLQESQIINEAVKAGWMSLEEARQARDMGDIDPTHHFFIPFSITIKTGEEIMNPPEPEPQPALPGQPGQQPGETPPEEVPPVEPQKSVKKNFVNEAFKEAFWKVYVKRAENYEPRAVRNLKDMYASQEKEALRNLKTAVDRKQKLIDINKAQKAYKDAMGAVMQNVILEAAKNGYDLLELSNPHKQDIPPTLNRRALEWLLSRMTWAAEQTSEETATLLANALAEGFKLGESTDQISKRVKAVFDNCTDVRAKRIARTEIITASNQGALEGYKEVGVAEVEFYAALDERTCAICMSLHGEIFPIEDSTNLITGTTHPNCRCVLLPVIK